MFLLFFGVIAESRLPLKDCAHCHMCEKDELKNRMLVWYRHKSH